MQAWDNLNRDLLQNAEDIGRTTAHALFPVMLHDDVWDAFEVVSLPFTANPGTPMTESLIVLDSAKRVYVSSRPQEHPLLSPLATLGPDFAALDRELPMARRRRHLRARQRRCAAHLRGRCPSPATACGWAP